jgi:hypothetical protein
MATFVSYARQDRELVGGLKVDLERLGREVWIDEKLRGGQEWWDEILAAIRSCDLFVWTVSPASVKSTACKAELTYASDLGRPVLPIMIKPVAIGLTPQRVANSQIVDYTTRGADQAIKLAGDLQAIQLPPPLPPTLPEPPPVPISYLEGYAEKLGAPAQMSASDQREVLDFLRPLATSTEDPEETQAACDLLRRLRARPEVTFEAATAIDQLLEHAPDRTPTPHGNRKVETTEFLTPVQPSQWSQPAPPPPPTGFPPPPQPAVSPTAPVGSGTPWSTGAFVALLLATLFSLGVVGIVAGLIGRSTPATRSQANILLWSGVGVLALCILAVAMGGATDSCDPSVEFC